MKGTLAQKTKREKQLQEDAAFALHTLAQRIIEGKSRVRIMHKHRHTTQLSRDGITVQEIETPVIDIRLEVYEEDFDKERWQNVRLFFGDDQA